VPLEIFRGGEKRTITVRVGRRPRDR